MLILASSSPYRQAQLNQLGLSFKVVHPQITELNLVNEKPAPFAQRMAYEKAKAVSSKYQNAIVIGADQVCEFNGQIIRKPRDHVTAKQQLLSFSGNQVIFHSALCVMHQDEQLNNLSETTIRFRKLTINLIEQYLLHDQPYDCAGSFKIEKSGLRLMKSVQSNDPSALIGLPLIALTESLNQLGFKWQ